MIGVGILLICKKKRRKKMKIRPILFSTAMVQALLDGRKTMTRRTKGLEGLENFYFQSLVHHASGLFTFVENGNYSPTKEEIKNAICPYGQVGDVLWVRETFKKSDYTPNGYTYKANAHPQMPKKGWKPNIHMPKEACRMWLEITNVRVERLNDITEADAIAEGVLLHERGTHWLNYEAQKHGLTQFIYNLRSAKKSFESLWEVINGKESLLSNPWVWVIEYKKVGMPAGFLEGGVK